MACQHRFTTAGRRVPCHHAEGRCLPCPIDAQQPETLPGGDPQAQPVHSRAPLPTVHLGQVPEDQHVPCGGPPGDALPLPSHVLILLSQGWWQSRFGWWQKAIAVLEQECDEEEQGALGHHGQKVLADDIPAKG